MDAIIRQRHGAGGPPGWRDDPWRLKRELQPATMAGLLCRMAAEERASGSGSRWRATVSAEQRSRIEESIAQSREQLAARRGVHSGTTAEVAPHAA
ncbi:hypothetical protein [Streptomyces rochei]|uniref:hypothetical protein n=1 Tax=Streptomyces rochei TaxID=1928 RepID=UPI0033A8B488